MTRVARITVKIAWPQLVVDCTVVAYSIAPLKKADPPVGFFIFRFYIIRRKQIILQYQISQILHKIVCEKWKFSGYSMILSLRVMHLKLN